MSLTGTPTPARVYLSGVLACALLTGCFHVDRSDSGLLISIPTTFPGDEPQADCWPGWRGAGLQGICPHPHVPLHWSSGDGVRWKAAVPGQGNSSPVVWGERIFLTSVVEDDAGNSQLAILCFDRHTGRLIWQRELGSPEGASHHKNGFASATVASDAERVFATFAGRGLFCYDHRGRRLWHAPLGPMAHEWGSASSPVLYGDLVIQTCDSQSGDSFVAAFHAATGQRIWKTARASHGSWGTPILVQTGEQQVELVLNGTGNPDGSAGFVIAYDPATGRERWRVQGTTDIPCPTAISDGQLVVSTSGGNGPILAIRPGGRGDVTSSHQAWRHSSGGPYVPTGVAYRGRLYLVSDGGTASCYGLAEGDRKWRTRLRGTFSASLTAGEGRIYAVSEQGDVYVFAAADEFRILATNRMGERCLATPALIAGQMLLRTEQHLYCIESQTSGVSGATPPSGAGQVTAEPKPSDEIVGQLLPQRGAEPAPLPEADP